MLNALTIDVEDYYQVSAFESVIRFEDWVGYESRVNRNSQRVLDILDEYNTKATFFVLGWIAERHPELVHLIHQRGHEIASHGYAHRRIYTQAPDQFREETRRSKKIVEDIIGESIIGYRAASYSITERSLWALDILVGEGYRYDSSIFPIWHDVYGIPRHQRFVHILNGKEQGGIAEIPLSTVRVAGINIPVAGGAYLRLFPYAVTHRAILHLNRKEMQPAVVYLHPWEIDPDQPRIQASWMSGLRHYTNLGGMETKLRTLLSNFSFGPVREVYRANLTSQASSNKVDKAAVPNALRSSKPWKLRSASSCRIPNRQQNPKRGGERQAS